MGSGDSVKSEIYKNQFQPGQAIDNVTDEG